MDYPPELFDLDNDLQELNDLGASDAHAEVRARMAQTLESICDPEVVNTRAKAAQNRLIEAHGGREKAMHVGAPAATPVPNVAANFGE